MQIRWFVSHRTEPSAESSRQDLLIQRLQDERTHVVHDNLTMADTSPSSRGHLGRKCKPQNAATAAAEAKSDKDKKLEGGDEDSQANRRVETKQQKQQRYWQEQEEKAPVDGELCLPARLPSRPLALALHQLTDPTPTPNASQTRWTLRMRRPRRS